MVLHSQAPVAPNNGGAADATASGNAGPAFARFDLVASFGRKPVEAGGSGGECACAGLEKGGLESRFWRRLVDGDVWDKGWCTWEKDI